MKKLLWHIDRAAFRFENPDDYDTWKIEKKVFFEFSPSHSDDAGDELFESPEKQETHFEVTEENGEVSITLEDEGPVITAWVLVEAAITENFNEEFLEEWSSDMGGWASSTIDLGEYEAVIVEDDGGDWRIYPED